MSVELVINCYHVKQYETLDIILSVSSLPKNAMQNSLTLIENNIKITEQKVTSETSR